MGLSQSSTPPLLSETQVTFFLLERSGWSVVDGALTKTFEFGSFVNAISFVDEVAVAAEQVTHHPDIDIRGNKVTVALITHDAGGLTMLDTHMATLIEEAAASELDGLPGYS